MSFDDERENSNSINLGDINENTGEVKLQILDTRESEREKICKMVVTIEFDFNLPLTESQSVR